MTRTLWLASYPKSGNTWLRIMLACLALEDGETVDINNLPERGGIASAREPFDFLTLIDSGLLTHDEIDALRPRVYETLAQGARDDVYDDDAEAPAVRFVKVHDAYTRNRDGEALLAGARGAAGAVVIVRDPRDVAPSLANHNQVSLDQAIDSMNDPRGAMGRKLDRQAPQLRQKLLGWSGHVQSWLEQSDIPVHLLRYEDMQADTGAALGGVLAFAGQPASPERIARAVGSARFDALRTQEEARGFREAVGRGSIARPFFRRGESGAWRDELSPGQIARLEAAHAPMMRRLGYRLSTEEACARAV